MLFNTINFFLFLTVVLVVHKALPIKGRPFFLLVASYFFYASWDVRFLALLIISTLIDYFCGLALAKQTKESIRKKILGLSVLANLGILLFFKYFDFFADSMHKLFAGSGIQPDERFLNVILPVGISFYTFQTMSYTIDVYRRKIKPERNLIYFSLYVAFFPQLVAGPIERAGNLLSQLRRPHSVNRTMVAEAFWLIIYGLFKKVVVADNLAILVQPVFDHPTSHHGFINLLALYAGAIYHYTDFSGYSDMACGIARLFGVRLMFNFRLPLFQSNPRNFWNHWHISLTLWFRDYVYIPLRRSWVFRQIPPAFHDPVAVIVTFSLIGIWHGPDMHFFVWGLINGLLIAAYNILVNIKKSPQLLPSALNTIAFQLWFIPTMGAFMVCRSTADALLLLANAFKPFEFNGGLLAATMAAFALPLFLFDGVLHRHKDLLFFPRQKAWVLQAVILVLWLFILTAGFTSKHDFIYFQF